MTKYVLRPKAVEDMTSIWDYTIEMWGREQAERYVRMLDRTFSELVVNPNLGRSCDFIRQGYRKYRVGRHLVFYRTFEGDIEVVRVLHQSMNFRAILKNSLT